MIIEKLISELRNDPLARGYAAMTPQQAADSLNNVDRAITRQRMIGRLDLNRFGLVKASKIWQAIKTANEQMAYTLEQGALDVNDPDVQALLSTVIATTASEPAAALALRALANATISRAEETGIGTVTPGDVGAARYDMGK